MYLKSNHKLESLIIKNTSLSKENFDIIIDTLQNCDNKLKLLDMSGIRFDSNMAKIGKSKLNLNYTDDVVAFYAGPNCSDFTSPDLENAKLYYLELDNINLSKSYKQLQRLLSNQSDLRIVVNKTQNENSCFYYINKILNYTRGVVKLDLSQNVVNNKNCYDLKLLLDSFSDKHIRVVNLSQCFINDSSYSIIKESFNSNKKFTYFNLERNCLSKSSLISRINENNSTINLKDAFIAPLDTIKQDYKTIYNFINQKSSKLKYLKENNTEQNKSSIFSINQQYEEQLFYQKSANKNNFLNVFKGHDYYYGEICKFSNDILISSNGCNLKCWSISLNACVGNLEGHKELITSICKMNDDVAVSGSKDKTIKVWRVKSKSCTTTLVGHEKSVNTVCKISDNLLASGSDDETIKIWSIDSEVCIVTIECECKISFLSRLSNDVVVSSYGCGISFWSISKKSCIAEFNKNFFVLSTLIIGNTLVALSESSVYAVSTQSTEVLYTLVFENKEKASSMTKVSDDIIAVGIKKPTIIRLWSLNSKSCILTLNLNCYDDITYLCKVTDDLLCARFNDKISLMSISSKSNIINLEDNVEAVCKINEDLVAFGSQKLQIWSINANSFVANFSTESYIQVISKVTNDLLATALLDSSIKVYSISSKSLLIVFKGHKNTVVSLCSITNDLLASGSTDKSVMFWSLSKKACTVVLNDHKDSVYGICSLDESTLVTGSSDIKVISVNLKKCVLTLTGHTKEIKYLCSITNDVFASLSKDKTVKVWSLTSKECIVTIPIYEYSVSLSKVTNDIIAVLSPEEKLQLWSVKSGISLTNLEDKINSVKNTVYFKEDSIISIGYKRLAFSSTNIN